MKIKRKEVNMFGVLIFLIFVGMMSGTIICLKNYLHGPDDKMKTYKMSSNNRISNSFSAKDGTSVCIINGKKYTGSGGVTITYGVIMMGKKVVNDIDDISDKHIVITGNIEGDVISDLPITVNGNIKGNVEAGGSVNCDDVGGSVKAGGSVNCDDVGGSINAGGSVNR